MGALIAKDGQWRFPDIDSIPEKIARTLITFEDKNYYFHPGFDLLALGRAAIQNIRAGKIVSGGSTLTMQVIRLSRKGRPRTIHEKLIEILLATRLELACSKHEILALYCSHAPFGGNVVGIDAAAWRYFGREPSDLSWAEAATLAVLPNTPSLIHPGRNTGLLHSKRNRLLKKMLEKQIIDSLTYSLSIDELLPFAPLPLPMNSPHLVARLNLSFPGQRVFSTINYDLQKQVNQVLSRHQARLASNGIHNAAAMIMEVETGHVTAYTGNILAGECQSHGQMVDIITSPRSTGSILKPFLFASMIDEGEILPGMLIPDIPTRISGFSPKNYTLSYDGAIPASRALSRSLNIPAVRMLQQHGLGKYHDILKKAGLTTINYPPSHYGLTLILGGAEATLWDLCGVYGSMSRVLNHYTRYNGKYDKSDFHGPVIKSGNERNIPGEQLSTDYSVFSAAAIWTTYEAMIEVNRPDEEFGWQEFSSRNKIAWKTGTSYGNRDAWAIGTTPEHVIGVWVGNADGEGRPLLTGVNTAAPILFELNKLLPFNEWFEVPLDEMIEVPVCPSSGHRVSVHCPSADTILIPVPGLRTPSCPYHEIIHLTKDKKYRVSANCVPVSEMIHESWFILPPVMEWYYKKRNPSYRVLPPFHDQCRENNPTRMMDLIYPVKNQRVYIPKELDGTPGEMVMEATHRKADTEIFWHLDKKFLGSTRDIHQLAIHPEAGKCTLTLIDIHGEEITCRFEVIHRR